MGVAWAVGKWIDAYELAPPASLELGALERVVHDASRQRPLPQGVPRAELPLIVAREAVVVHGACKGSHPCLLDLLESVPPALCPTPIGTREAFLKRAEQRWWYLRAQGVTLAEIDPGRARADFEAFVGMLANEWLGVRAYMEESEPYPVPLISQERKRQPATLPGVFEPHQLIFRFDPRVRSLVGFVKDVSCGAATRRSRSQPFDKLAAKVLDYQIVESRLRPLARLDAPLGGSEGWTLRDRLTTMPGHEIDIDSALFAEHAREAVLRIAGPKEWAVWVAASHVPKRGTRRDYRAIGREAGLMDCPRTIKRLFESADSIVTRLAMAEMTPSDMPTPLWLPNDPGGKLNHGGPSK